MGFWSGWWPHGPLRAKPRESHVWPARAGLTPTPTLTLALTLALTPTSRSDPHRNQDHMTGGIRTLTFGHAP